jgi:hypothetical protein
VSAEALRRAAALMRERAEAAEASLTPDWWEAHALDWLTGASGVPSLAAHIASWHPAVALAVADWLDEAAALIAAAFNPEGLVEHRPDLRAALAAARAYLGEDQ